MLNSCTIPMIWNVLEISKPNIKHIIHIPHAAATKFPSRALLIANDMHLYICVCVRARVCVCEYMYVCVRSRYGWISHPKLWVRDTWDASRWLRQPPAHCLFLAIFRYALRVPFFIFRFYCVILYIFFFTCNIIIIIIMFLHLFSLSFSRAFLCVCVSILHLAIRVHKYLFDCLPCFLSLTFMLLNRSLSISQSIFLSLFSSINNIFSVSLPNVSSVFLKSRQI